MYLQYIKPIFSPRVTAQGLWCPQADLEHVHYDSRTVCQGIMNCAVWGSGMTQLWYSSLLKECIKEEKQLYRSGVVSMEHFACWGNSRALCPAKHGMRKEPWNTFVCPSDYTGSFNRALCASADIQRERLCASVRARMFVCALLFEVVWTMKQNKRLDRKKRLLSR